MILTLALAATLATTPNTAGVRCVNSLVYAWNGWVWASSGEKCVDLPAPDVTKWEQLAAQRHETSKDVEIAWSVPQQNVEAELTYKHIHDLHLTVNILVVVCGAILIALVCMWAWLNEKLSSIQDSLIEDDSDG